MNAIGEKLVALQLEVQLQKQQRQEMVLRVFDQLDDVVRSIDTSHVANSTRFKLGEEELLRSEDVMRAEIFHRESRCLTLSSLHCPTYTLQVIILGGGILRNCS